MQTHAYGVAVRWTGNRGTGTSGYRAYDRTHEVTTHGRPPIAGSSDPVFRGEADRWNPEQLLIAAAAQCHLLSYLHQCADAAVVVTSYADSATGTMVETADGGGHFTEITLRPLVTVADESMVAKAVELHTVAHRACFICASLNFAVRHEPTVSTG